MDDAIKTESGQVVGHWNGLHAADLKRELQHIMAKLKETSSAEKLNPRDMPHRDQLPTDLIGFKSYRLWGCDKDNMCVVGTKADRIEPVEKVLSFSLIDHH